MSGSYIPNSRLILIFGSKNWKNVKIIVRARHLINAALIGYRFQQITIAKNMGVPFGLIHPVIEKRMRVARRAIFDLY